MLDEALEALPHSLLASLSPFHTHLLLGPQGLKVSLRPDEEPVNLEP